MASTSGRWASAVLQSYWWAIAIAIAAWILFGVYESYMYHWSRTVIAPIRVDLLLLTPILYAVTVIGLVQAFMRRHQLNRSDRS